MTDQHFLKELQYVLLTVADYVEEDCSVSEYERHKAVTAEVERRLAQPEPQPVAWINFCAATARETIDRHCHSELASTPLYTAPPQRKWQGLTDEEMMVATFQAGFDVHEDYDNEDDPDALHWWSEDGEPCDDTLYKLRDIIEAKLKEKNT